MSKWVHALSALIDPPFFNIPPVFTEDRCDPVPRPLNTVPDTTNTSWYTNVTYTCAIGHEWPGNKTEHKIMCLVGGEWTETEDQIPPCQSELFCP